MHVGEAVIFTFVHVSVCAFAFSFSLQNNQIMEKQN